KLSGTVVTSMENDDYYDSSGNVGLNNEAIRIRLNSAFTLNRWLSTSFGFQNIINSSNVESSNDETNELSFSIVGAF
ncbi:MAG: hypothetical protein GY786_19610, partial [Proteobacteria bacterium]|nr:hypothetical protein [Pseudomonadota bacterium]